MDSLCGSPLSNFASEENYASKFDYDEGNFECDGGNFDYEEGIDDVSDGISSPVNATSLVGKPSISRRVDQDVSSSSDNDNALGYSEFDENSDNSLTGNLPLKKKTPFSRSTAHDHDYIKDLWELENAQGVGRNKITGKWTGNKAPELGGKTDYGPGLKLKYKSGGYTQSEIDSALTSKIDDIETKLRKDVQKHGKNYDSLNRDQKKLLVDYSYNTGDAFKKFPKFSKAVIEGDKKTMYKEYKRSWKDKGGVRQELKGRNQWTKSVIDDM